MSRFVVDASAAVKWLIPEIHSEHARKLLDGDHELLVPDLLFAEFGNVLWKRVHAGEMTGDEADAVVGALMQVPLQAHPSSALLGPALEIANRTQRTVYDSLYLALALREDAALVTADCRLFSALQTTPLAAELVWVENVV